MGTAYTVEVRSNCGDGYVSDYVAATFTTVAECTAPLNIGSSDVTPSSATYSWDAVSNAE